MTRRNRSKKKTIEFKEKKKTNRTITHDDDEPRRIIYRFNDNVDKKFWLFKGIYIVIDYKIK